MKHLIRELRRHESGNKLDVLTIVIVKISCPKVKILVLKNFLISGKKSHGLGGEGTKDEVKQA